MLIDHYENQRVLVRAYYSAFTALQKMKSESATKLRRIVHAMYSTAGVLSSIGRPITEGNDLFIHLVVEFFDARSRRE